MSTTTTRIQCPICGGKLQATLETEYADTELTEDCTDVASHGREFGTGDSRIYCENDHTQTAMIEFLALSRQPETDYSKARKLELGWVDPSPLHDRRVVMLGKPGLVAIMNNWPRAMGGWCRNSIVGESAARFLQDLGLVRCISVKPYPSDDWVVELTADGEEVADSMPI